jgi:hypothetical protein
VRPQELVALHDKYGAQGLEIVAFPCNQFGRQARARSGARERRVWHKPWPRMRSRLSPRAARLRAAPAAFALCCRGH